METLWILVAGLWSLVPLKTLSFLCKSFFSSISLYSFFFKEKKSMNMISWCFFWCLFLFYYLFIFIWRGAPSQNLSGTLSFMIQNLTNLQQMWVTFLCLITKTMKIFSVFWCVCCSSCNHSVYCRTTTSQEKSL